MPNSLYMVTMEYAHVAEAGGVKLVARSLCEELSRQGWCVTVVMPMFGCTDTSRLENIKQEPQTVDFVINGKKQQVSFVTAVITDHLSLSTVHCILVCAGPFAEKRAVYTYTAEEEAAYPQHKAGTGHTDVLVLDTLLCKAAAHLVEHPISGDVPDIVLCQDAACACVPVYLNYSRSLSASSTPVPFRPHCVVTIHNAAPAYHHEFSSLDEAAAYTLLPHEVLCGAFNGRTVEPYLLAAECAALTTVSEYYAHELLDKNSDAATDGLATAFRTRGIQVTGILNGIDYDRYDPAGDQSLLPYKFDAIKGNFEGKRKCREQLFRSLSLSTLHSPLSTVFCFHGRLVRQKGIHILCQAMRQVLDWAGREGKMVLFVAMGQGESALEDMMAGLAKDYPRNAVYIKGYDKALSRLIIASSDFIVLPSITEPCGQEDYIAQIYGTLPVAHATGGLNKIIDGQTGFLYRPNTPQTLCDTLCSLIDRQQADAQGMRSVAQNAAKCVKECHSWKVAVDSGYLPLFHRLMAD